MSILNRASDGLFNMVTVLYNTLRHEGPMNRDKLLAMVAPASVSEDRKMASNSLNRWIDLGLFEESDGNVKLKTSEKGKSTASLSSTMRRLVLSQDNNRNFWDAEGSASADFTRALAWLLAQNVYSCSLFGHGDAATLENNQIALPDRAVFQNDTRWHGFKAWALFLGFGVSSLKRGAFEIDPTVAVRESLDTVFDGINEMSIYDFIERLAEVLPVIDGGLYRKEVESQLNPRHWESVSEREISTSLSRALLRLREAGVLRLDNRSDSPTRMEMLLQGKRTQSVTHVIRAGAH
ncbi:MAG: protein DpdG [Planctomycetaceae bacterium]|jgi:hypothetical protein